MIDDRDAIERSEFTNCSQAPGTMGTGDALDGRGVAADLVTIARHLAQAPNHVQLTGDSLTLADVCAVA